HDNTHLHSFPTRRSSDLDKLIEHDPTLNIDSPKQWKVLPKALARDEMEAILSGSHPASDRQRDEAIALRNRAMLEVFYAGALRVDRKSTRLNSSHDQISY